MSVAFKNYANLERFPIVFLSSLFVFLFGGNNQRVSVRRTVSGFALGKNTRFNRREIRLTQEKLTLLDLAILLANRTASLSPFLIRLHSTTNDTFTGSYFLGQKGNRESIVDFTGDTSAS